MKFQTDLACYLGGVQRRYTPSHPYLALSCGSLAKTAVTIVCLALAPSRQRARKLSGTMSALELDPSQGQPGRPVDISSGAGAGEAVPEIPATALVGFGVEIVLGLRRQNWRVRPARHWSDN
jgi:hypothetical protein